MRHKNASGYVVKLSGGQLAKFEAQMELFFEDAKMPTVEEFGPIWLEDATARRQKHSYVNYKRLMLAKYLLPNIGKLRLSEIPGAGVDKMRAATTHLAPKSVNNILCLLGNMLSVAEAKGYRQLHSGWKQLKTVQPVAEYYSFRELELLLEAAREVGPEATAIVLLAAHAGLRRGEIMGLQWRDIDLGGQSLHVQRSLVGGVLDSPKSGRSRTIPMTPSLVVALQALPRKGEFVLVGMKGKHVSTKWMYNQMKCISEKCPIKIKGKLHTLRHTFCSHLAMHGVSALAIKELAGHSTLEVTQRYMHLQNNLKKEAIAVLEKNPAAF